VETEIRQLLRERAGDVGLDDVMPRSTFERARRRRALTGVAAAGTVAAVIIGAVLGVGAITGSRAIDYIDQPMEPTRVTSVPLGDTPYGLAHGFGSVWAAAGGDVTRIDPRTGKATARIELTGGPRRVGDTTERDRYTVLASTLTAGDDAMWVLGQRAGTEFSATAVPLGASPSGEGQTTATFSMEAHAIAPQPQATSSLRAQSQGPPVGSPTPGPFLMPPDEWSLLRIDPRDNSVRETDRIEVGLPPQFMTAGEGGIWLATENGRLDGSVWRFSGKTGKLEERFQFRGIPMGVAAQGGSVYVAFAPALQGKLVLRIDPKANRIVDEIAIPGVTWARAITAADDDVWVSAARGESDDRDYLVARIDARSGRLLGTIEVPSNLAKMAAGGGFLWGVPETEGESVLRIVGNVLAGRLSLQRLPVSVLVEAGKLWLGGVPAELNVSRYEF
jgi:hypothetical protein